jgi:hypothetical protein
VVVLSGSNLRQLFKADTAGVEQDISSVGWSQDGRFLFAGGYWSVNNVPQVRRWSEGGKGAFVDIAAGSDTIMKILGLMSGSMLFAHQKGFGLIGPDAKVTPLQGLGGLDLNNGGGYKLRVSADGGAVQVDSWQPRHTYRFALGERRVAIDPPPDASLLDPITQAPGRDITNWKNSTTPAVNGAPIKLERLVVVAYGDGTIRWLRLSDGKELLALFIHPDGKRWIAWTPQDYYDASVGGDGLIGWHVNHGYDQAPDFYPVSQFRDQFNRSDIVALVLKTLDVDEAVRQANAVSGRKAAAAVAGSLPPVVTIVSPSDRSSVAASPIAVTYQVRSPTPVTGITVLVGGRPVAMAPSPENDRLVSLSIDMPQHNAIISLVAANEKASSEAAVVHIGWQGAKDWYKPDLYVLAVGVSKYNDKNLNLTYPDKDAEDFVKVMRAQAGGLYRMSTPATCQTTTPPARRYAKASTG